jgi:hypothetical protein
MARKNLIENNFITNQINPADKLDTQILVERIKNDYIKQMKNISGINQCKNLIALLLTCKLNIKANTTIDSGFITKIFNK